MSESEDSFTLSLEEAAQGVLAAAKSNATGRVSIDPERVEQDIAKLVLALMEFLRQLVELQAIRRIEAGSLSEAQEERLGLALMRSRDKLVELAGEFDLTEDDLRLDLGPLGRLV